MRRADRVTDAAGQKMTFLPDHFDSCLLGYARRGGSDEAVACYGYQAAKAAMMDRYKTPDRAYAELDVALNAVSKENVLWLVRYARRELWRIIEEQQYSRWEFLDRAVIGIGYMAGRPCGIVYSKALCVDIFTDNVTLSTQDQTKTQLDAIEFIEHSIAGLDLGEGTPWFLTHIK